MPPKTKALLEKARSRISLTTQPSLQEPGMLESLTRTLYPNSETAQPGYYTWQYQNNPAGPSIDCLGKVDGHIAGHYAVVPMRYQIDQTPVRASLSVNTMTHPDFRNKGLFMLLAEDVYADCEKQGIPFTLGFPNPNSRPGFLKHLDFQDLGEIPLWLLPLDLNTLARTALPNESALLRSAVRAVAPLLNVCLQFLKRFKWASFDFNVREVDEAGSELDAFWEKTRKDYPQILVRDTKFLTWRFLKHPTRKYRLLVCQKGAVVLGYLILRTSIERGILNGYIVDLLVARNNEGLRAARALLQHAVEFFQKEKAALIGALALPHTPFASALRATGFLQCPKRFLPQPFAVILRSHTETLAPGLTDLSRWYLTMADYDVA